MSGGAYRAAVRLIALAMILLGIAVVVRTLSLGGGPLSFGLIVGIILIAIGCARLWLAVRLGRSPR